MFSSFIIIEFTHPPVCILLPIRLLTSPQIYKKLQPFANELHLKTKYLCKKKTLGKKYRKILQE